MENPVQELIVGNVSGATGVEGCYEVEVTEQSEMISDEGETQPTAVGNEEFEKIGETENVIDDTVSSEVKHTVIPDEENHCAAVQTTAMRAKESKPQRTLKVTTIAGLDLGPEQLIEQQKADQTLKRYWEHLLNSNAISRF